MSCAWSKAGAYRKIEFLCNVGNSVLSIVSTEKA